MKAEGFPRMDISTTIHHDPKFRLLARRHPDLVVASLATYLVLLAESWREGARLTVEESTSLVPYDEAVVEALAEAGLVDADGRVPERAWENHFGAASARRAGGRERQQRADAKRGRTASKVSPPVNHPVNQTINPSTSQADRSSDGPALDQRWSGGYGRAESAESARVCPACNGLLTVDDDSNIVQDPHDGRFWHQDCPDGLDSGSGEVGE